MGEGEPILELEGDEPRRLIMFETTPEDHATRVYSICADYGWAQKTICGGMYESDCRDIVRVLADRLGVEVVYPAIEINGRPIA